MNDLHAEPTVVKVFHRFYEMAWVDETEATRLTHEEQPHSSLTAVKIITNLDAEYWDPLIFKMISKHTQYSN